jgi:D-lactate dehydrogenase
MKAVVYGIKPFEKESLAKANQKKHDITLITNPLSLETTTYAEGKEAVIAFTHDTIPETVISQLTRMGVKHIASCMAGTQQMRKEAGEKRDEKPSDLARQAINDLDLWQQNKTSDEAFIDQHHDNEINLQH